METQVEGTERGGYPQSTEAAAGSSQGCSGQAKSQRLMGTPW